MYLNEVHQVAAVQDHVVSLGLTTRTEIGNCRVQRVKGDEWVSVERCKDEKRTYPHLEWQGGEFVVASKKRKSPSSSSGANEAKNAAKKNHRQKIVLKTVCRAPKVVDSKNIRWKEGNKFRVVSTTFRERTTNAKGCICLPSGGYQTAAGIVYAEFEDTQRPRKRGCRPLMW